MKLEICEKLYNLIIEELHSSIEEVKLEDIKEIKSMIVLKNISDEHFYKMLSMLRKENDGVEIYMIGDGCNNKLVDESHIFFHKGRFEIDEQNSFNEKIRELDVDVILYENYDVYKSTYLNVMEYVAKLPNKKGQIWVYCVNEKNIIKHRDLPSFIENLRFIVPLVHYINHYTEK